MEIESGGNRIIVEQMISPIDTFLNNVFEFEMIKGNFNDIAVENTLIIPLSLAENMFDGPENAIGQEVFRSDDNDDSYPHSGCIQRFL